MYKLDLEKAEVPDIKLPTFGRSWRKQGSSRKTSSASLTTLKPLTLYFTTNWEILKEMGILDHLTCLLRNLHVSQRSNRKKLHGSYKEVHGTVDWVHIGKGVGQGCILSPYLFNLYAEYFMRNARLDEAQAWMKHRLESRLPGAISATSYMQMIPF